MAEYIEREATCRDCFHYDVCDYHITEMTTMTINECPHKFVNKADVVEVVRCKDCKHYCLSDYRKPNEPRWCEKFEDGNYFPKPTDFCSLGAKMDGKDRQYDKY
jgi:hypothetical protein